MQMTVRTVAATPQKPALAAMKRSALSSTPLAASASKATIAARCAQRSTRSIPGV